MDYNDYDDDDEDEQQQKNVDSNKKNVINDIHIPYC